MRQLIKRFESKCRVELIRRVGLFTYMIKWNSHAIVIIIPEIENKVLVEFEYLFFK